VIHKGAYTYDLGINVLWDLDADLFIGKFCSIGKDLTVYLGGNHRADWISTFPIAPLEHDHRTTKGNVVIGNNVWIGNGVTIMSGVTIGDGAVIGALSVVTKDVQAYSLVAGNPAEFKRFRFPYGQVERLSKIAWWDWPAEKIQEARPLLLSGEVEHFIKFAEGVK